MYSLCRLLRSSSATPLLRCHGGLQWTSRLSSVSGGPSGYSSGIFADESTEHKMPFDKTIGTSQSSVNSERSNIFAPNTPSFSSFAQSLRNDNGMRRNNRSIDFVRGIFEEEGRDSMGMSPFYRPNFETNANIVHLKMKRNNTFVTITDSKGCVKYNASCGFLPELKGGGARISRYAAEATAEHVGRKAKELGLKSVVVKVNGFTFFKKKKQAIMAFRDGFTNSRSDQNPIVYIEDTTRQAHNGCRLPRKRRN